MFINLTCRKANGDFYITSSEVEQENHPEIKSEELREWMVEKANFYFAKGWDVELTQTEAV